MANNIFPAPWFSIRGSITTVVIDEGVTSIGERAFYECVRLTSVTISNSVTTIGEGAFLFCTDLTSVTIGNSVRTIESNAFAYCTGLTSVTIPNSVTTIGGGVFAGCTGLTSVTIPNSVTTIGGGVFAGCTGLTSINVNPDNANFSSEYGVLFNKNKATLIKYPPGREGEYTIPNSVTTIGEQAFMDCTGLTSVTIPNSVTTIGEQAFNGCTGLTSVTIPNSVTTIGEWAFIGCTGLTSVTIPNSVTTIGERAFNSCTGLTSIISLRAVPPSVGLGAFLNINASACLYVPQGSISAYGEASVWKDFSCINPFNATVTFDSQGGSAVIPQTVLIDNKVAKPTDPTRPNHVFIGWYKEAACINQWDFDTDVVTSATTLYAKWIINTYTVTFVDGLGNTIGTPQTISHGSNATPPTNPTRDTHNFTGWSGIYTNITSNRTITALWAIKTYIVTWNADGGTPAPTQTSVSHGNSITAPVAMTRFGYTFGGWYSNEALTSAVTFPIANVTTPRTLYAKWTLNTYTVTWNTDGGTPAPTQTTVSHGNNITAPAPMTKTAYTFDNWYTNEALTIPATFPIANVTMTQMFYAKWTSNNYTIIYHGNSSIAGTAPSTQTAAYNTTVTLSDKGSLEKIGHTFTGWNTTQNGTGIGYNAGESFTIPATNTTLYAQWTINNYNVTYNGNGHTGGTAPSFQTSAYNTTISVRGNTGNLQKTGYTFAGWNTQSDGQGTDYASSAAFTIPADNVVLYAKWNINNYTVTFVDYDGTTILKTQTNVPHGTGATPPTDPTLTGYTFTGWNPAYNNVTGNLTVTAQYTINTYTVTFVDYDGTTVLKTQTNVPHGTEAAPPANPTRTGHTFTGWSPAYNNVTGNLTVTAQYTINICEHDFSVSVTDVPATCTNDGAGHYKCSLCGAAGANFIIDMLGHSLTWAITIPATCTYTGEETVTCQRIGCTHNEINKIPMLTGNDCSLTAISSPERTAPTIVQPNTEAGIALTSEFTAGPNPVARSSGNVNFFRQGKWIESATLTIFDASGNVVNRIKITDNALDGQSRREVGSWDLKDAKGRPVSEGTYLVRGTVTASDGIKGESIIDGWR